MTLHAIKPPRDPVTGEWVARCGLRGLRDLGRVPRSSPKVAERYGQFETALHEADVDCPGCQLVVPAGARWLLAAMFRHGRWAYLRPSNAVSVNAARRPVVIYVAQGDIDWAQANHLIKDTGTQWHLTASGASLGASSQPRKKEKKT